MKSKNILPNVKKKSLSEAQDEIKEIISHLEDTETNLEESTEKYQRMIQLDNHIKKEFKSKINKRSAKRN